VERDPSLAKDGLFAQIRRRHTHKGPFDSKRAVPPAVWQRLETTATEKGLLAGTVTANDTMATLRQITRDAFEAEMLTPRTYLESAHLLRIGPEEVEKHRDGIALMGTLPRLMSALRLYDRFEVPERGSSNHQQLMNHWAPSETASGYFWIASRENSRAAQLSSGRAYVRAHLHATAHGVDLHPLSQPVQEFAEVRPQFDALRSLLGFDGSTHTVQMLARVGYGIHKASPSPRRALEQLIHA
jgi:hypothetical protein